MFVDGLPASAGEFDVDIIDVKSVEAARAENVPLGRANVAPATKMALELLPWLAAVRPGAQRVDAGE